MTYPPPTGLHLAQFWRLSRQVLPVLLLASGSVGADVVSAAQAQLADRTQVRALGARWVAVWGRSHAD
jgi:hypothetical protein